MFRRLRPAASLTIGLALMAAVLVPGSKAEAQVDLPLAVNFQDQAASTPSGYDADYGQAYDAGRGFGWTNSSDAPLSLVGNGRDRNASSDQRLDTLMQPQLKNGSPGVSTEGRWKAAVENGTYEVTVAAGDASYYDSEHVVRVEGQTAIDFTPTSGTPFSTETIEVTVVDGFLNVDAVGGVNTKLNYVEADLVDSTPNPGDGDVANVNFQNESAATPDGYEPDFGQAFSAERGYGWEARSGGAPLDLTGNGRERNVLPDKRNDTFMHMAFGGPTNGVRTEGQWSVEVPNGEYDLTVGVGDASYYDSTHSVRAEGQTLGTFTPSSSNPVTTFNGTVEVADGKLTLDQGTGTNTKVTFVDVTPADGGTDPVDPEEPTGSSALEVESPQDYLGLGDRLVFSTVNYNTEPTETVTLNNPSAEAVQVTGFEFGGTDSGAFELAPGQSSNFEIAPGGSADVEVAFTPVKHESNQATMTVQTDENAAELAEVTLGGMNATNFEDVNEPSLQAIFDTFGYDVNAAVQYESTNFISKSAGAIGDEVLASYFNRADSSEPVNLHPLANYSGRSTGAKGPFGFNNKDQASAANSGYSLPGGSDVFGGQNQRLLPELQSGQSTAWNNPTQSFGFRDGNPGAVAYSDDKLNPGEQLHNVRVYPAVDADGQPIENSYLVGVDIGPNDCCFKNFDYQDYVFLMTNVTPESIAEPAPSVGANSLNRNFSSSAAGTVTDANGNGTGFAEVQPNTAGNQYDASKLNLNTATGHLEIKSGPGTNSSGTNNQVNALQSRFNASNNKFRIQSKFVGPFDFLNVNNEQQAIYFGPDQNNHLKAEVEYANGQHVLSIWKEQNGTGQIVQRTAVPGLASANTIDLRIDVDPLYDRKANVFYSINGGGFTKLNGGAISVPGTWMGVSVPAGILVSHQGGSEFTARFDSFAVVGW